MKSTILAILLSLTAVPAAFAGQVEVTCFQKYYDCRPGGFCGWNTIGQPIQRVVDLFRDTRYPSSDFPYEVFRGQMRTSFDRHDLTLDFLQTTQDQLNPLKVFATLDAGSVLAESSSTSTIDIALRNGSYGRGFLCTNFRLLN